MTVSLVAPVALTLLPIVTLPLVVSVPLPMVMVLMLLVFVLTVMSPPKVALVPPDSVRLPAVVPPLVPMVRPPVRLGLVVEKVKVPASISVVPP